MNVCVFGYLGVMGRRYVSILRSLGHQWSGVDVNGTLGTFWAQDADALIIATPTNTHAEVLDLVKDWGKPILCEKPVCKDMAKLEDLIDGLKKAGTRVQMVNQYDYLPKYQISGKATPVDGPTSYDYWNSGKDGLLWDCIQLIYHAKGAISLTNESPIWRATLNGNVLSIADMDQAYVTMIERWLVDPACHYERILEAHSKVHKLLEGQQACHAS